MNQGIPGIPIFKGNINLYGNKKAIYFAVLVIIDLQESGPPKNARKFFRAFLHYFFKKSKIMLDI